MSKGTGQSFGRLLTARALNEVISNAQDQEQAKSVIEQAISEAESHKKRTEHEASRRRSLIESAARREVAKEMAETKRKATALATVEIFKTSARVRDHFDSLRPWLVELVESSIHQILNEMPKSSITGKIVKAAIEKNKSDYTYTLVVGEGCYDDAVAFVREIMGTELEGSITEVKRGRNLQPEDVILVSNAGAIDVSLSVQLAAVRNELSAISEANPDEG